MSIIGNASGTAAKFKSPGDSVTGRITSFEDYQAKEFADDPARGVKKGDPKFYSDGNPVMAVRIELDTSDGEQVLYVESKRMKKAIRAAVRGSGARDLSNDSTLTVAFPGYDGAAKDYTAEYAEGAGDLPDDDELPF